MHAFPVDLYPHLVLADTVAEALPLPPLPPLPPLQPPRRASAPRDRGDLVAERQRKARVARVAAWLGVPGTQDSGDSN